MNDAAQRYVGTHDFRNLCKTDVANGVFNFQRTILSAQVLLVGQSLGEGRWQEPFQLCQFEVTGQAFLYHQVCCMMAVLILIGQGMEKPEVTDELLNIEKNPQKPQYSMAVEFPLVLYDCKFENVKWIHDQEVQEFSVTHLQQLWVSHAVKSHMLGLLEAALGHSVSNTWPQVVGWDLEGAGNHVHDRLKVWVLLTAQLNGSCPLPLSLVQNLPPGTGYQKAILAAQAQLQSDTGPLQAELLQCPAQLAELEAQVRKLELEQAQHRVLLESWQQRHQADLELIESAHSRSRIKVLETSYQQWEERLQRENEELSAQYLSHLHETALACTELIAQHQHPLAAAEREKDQERIQLLELQQSQMEQLSSSLKELASHVEALHLTTTQELELGIRQRDEQLQVLQELLDLQKRAMEEHNQLQEATRKRGRHT
ncbi:fas-binding factor 1-like [Octodon degus]|uniref:Fas-binding factor 1-like n=1 Tax=Octodon degus TaxID=10160 RepID=A0A6P6EC61_OCTDE|nr:fas-binding factor 1-like [Octodon degus]